MITFKLIPILFIASLIPAQDAIVVNLSENDSNIMKELYQMKADIELNIKTETGRIGHKYATWDDGIHTMQLDGTRIPPDFEFSKDFKHIVPKQSKLPSNNFNYPSFCTGGYTISPGE